MRELRGVAVAAIAAAVLLASPSTVRAQVSPGPLARAHRGLEGAGQCFQCHGAQRDAALDANCRGCHKEIAQLVADKRGLHAREGASGCARCHPEHGGEDFALVAWDGGNPSAFDHRRAGWPLEGKHAQLNCAACHARAAFQVGAAARLRPGPNPAGYVGLERECGTCHADVHRGALGPACTRCHTQKAWTVPSFDHARTSYPLTGRHTALACAKCHARAGLDLPHDANGRALPLFKPLAFAECSACHRDPHDGRFGAGCSRCHTTEDFRKVARESFDHARTRFPLRGRHATVQCARCHDPRLGGWGPRPAFDRCAACHKDAHAGTATLRGQAADCGACHNEQSYAPATYTVEQHDTAAYRLDGRHRAVQCRACHVRRDDAALGSSHVVLRPRSGACADCHADAHGGQFAARPDRGACDACHTTAGFKSVRFGVAEHAKLGLPLEGAHARVPCTACHGKEGAAALADASPGGPRRAGVLFRVSADCVACHVDPHQGRFSPGGERPSPRGCLTCHSVNSFVPSLVDDNLHRDYKMRIEGAHRTVPCSACHAELKSAPARSSLRSSGETARVLRFEVARQACADCHKSPHGTQFATRADGGDCGSCHGTAGFRPADRFVHDRDARFALRGAHVRVPCARCHIPAQDADGILRTVYRSAPSRCAACHARPS